MSKQYEKVISDSHPCEVETDEAYKADAIAMQLVGERHEKRELVDLVRWLIMDNAKTINPPPDTQEQGWQDIATAPKDGTEVLTFRGAGLMSVAAWVTIGQVTGWCCTDGCCLIKVTHWMPLPAAPLEVK